MKPFASFKGHNKGAAVYVQSITTVHNLCFAFTLWLNNFTVILLLFSCFYKIQNLMLFAHGQH